MLGSIRTALILGGAIILMVGLLSVCAYKPIREFIRRKHTRKVGDKVYRPQRLKK